VKDRSCTDVFCLLGFCAFLVVWGIVGFYAAINGDINRVIYPTDSQGRICGRGELEDRPNLLLFDLTKCLNFGVLAHGCVAPQVCVKECPTRASSGYALASKGQDTLAKTEMKPFCTKMSEDQWNSKAAKTLIEQKLCPAWVLPSTAILGRCLPIGTMTNKEGANQTVVSKEDTESGEAVSAGTLTKAVTRLGAFLGLREFVEKVGNDLADTYWMIGVALLGSTITSFIWIVLLRLFTGLMVWSSIFLLFFLASGTLAYSVYRYKWILDNVDMEQSDKTIFDVDFTPDYFNEVLQLQDTWLAFIVILSIILVVILLILIALRQRIQIAIKLIEQGSKAVSHMMSTLFFPIVPFCLHLFVIACFLTIAILLSSVRSPNNTIYFKSGDHDTPENVTVAPQGCDPKTCVNPDTNAPYLFNDTCTIETFEKADCSSCSEEVMCRFVHYSPVPDSVWMPWLNLFGFFWAMAFVSAFAEMVLAHAFATWYWTWEKKDVPFFTVTNAMFATTVFHLGTIAFGSLIIAIIRFIRAILDYVEKKLKMYNNDLTRCLLWCCKCCLWCLEKFMKFINRNAYIVCAMRSSNFCSSAKHAFELLIKNLVRVVVLNKVVDFLLFLGKLVIMAGAATLSYLVFSNKYFPDLHDNVPTLNYYVTPVVAIVIGTYFITSSFFGVYEMAVDTLFLCFLEDLDRNDGTPSKPYFMSKGLLNVVGKMNQLNEMQMRATEDWTDTSTTPIKNNNRLHPPTMVVSHPTPNDHYRTNQPFTYTPTKNGDYFYMQNFSNQAREIKNNPKVHHRK